jgi:hypothetical protein
MAEKGGFRISAVITICIILISTGLSGCIEDEEKKYPAGLYTYSVEFNTEESEFILYAPIPVLNNGSPFEAFNNLQIKYGKIEYSFINTIYGTAMNISGSNSFMVEAKLKGHINVDLSLKSKNKSLKEAGFLYWIFFNSTNNNKNNSLEIISDCDNWVENNDGKKTGPSDEKQEWINTSLNHGWNEYLGQYFSIIF